MKRFVYPFHGLIRLLQKDKHYFLHCAIAVLVILTAIILQINVIEWLFIISAIFIVLITESINTAIEESVNLVTKEFNEHAKFAKDIASFAVLLASIYSVIIGIIIFLPKLF